MPIFGKKLILEQHKEPALSKPIVRFVNPVSDNQLIELKNLTATSEQQAIIEMARLAEITDEREGTLVHKMLEKSLYRADMVIADALDDEPYVSSKLGPMLAFGDELAAGLDLCCRVAGCREKRILVYGRITDIDTRIPRSIDKIKVVRVDTGYPVSEQDKLGKLPPGKKLVIGAGALIHLARAAKKRKMQTTTFVTVAGNCVTNPMNLEVSVGMTVMQVLERCGLSKDPTRIVCGGSMTGFSIIEPDNTLVTFTTGAILALREDVRDRLYNCIGCGRCEQVCPTGLNPMYIQRFVENSFYAYLEPFDAHLCIGCGTCSYICPSKLEVSQVVGIAKRYADSHFVRMEDDDEA